MPIINILGLGQGAENTDTNRHLWFLSCFGLWFLYSMLGVVMLNDPRTQGAGTIWLLLGTGIVLVCITQRKTFLRTESNPFPPPLGPSARSPKIYFLVLWAFVTCAGLYIQVRCDEKCDPSTQEAMLIFCGVMVLLGGLFCFFCLGYEDENEDYIDWLEERAKRRAKMPVYATF